MRERLFNKTKDVVLVRPDGLEVSFGDKQYIDGSLEILNFRQLGSHSLAFLTVRIFVLRELFYRLITFNNSDFTELKQIISTFMLRFN